MDSCNLAQGAAEQPFPSRGARKAGGGLNAEEWRQACPRWACSWQERHDSVPLYGAAPTTNLAHTLPMYPALSDPHCAVGAAHAAAAVAATRRCGGAAGVGPDANQRICGGQARSADRALACLFGVARQAAQHAGSCAAAGACGAAEDICACARTHHLLTPRQRQRPARSTIWIHMAPTLAAPSPQRRVQPVRSLPPPHLQRRVQPVRPGRPPAPARVVPQHV